MGQKIAHPVEATRLSITLAMKEKVTHLLISITHEASTSGEKRGMKESGCKMGKLQPSPCIT